MKVTKLICALFVSATMLLGACGGSKSNQDNSVSVNAQPTDKEYREAQQTEEVIAEASAKPVELGPGDILEFGAPQPMPVVVDFNATWCGPCKAFKPIFEAAAKEWHGKVKFLSVDIDKCPGIAKEYGVESIPTILFVDQKGNINRQIGYMDAEAFKAGVEAILPPANQEPQIAPR